MEVTSDQIALWEEESEFGKLYGRALEYTLMRPHSAKEVRDYLRRKTLTRKVQVSSFESRVTASRKTNKQIAATDDADFTHDSIKTIEKPGVSQAITDRVYERLLDRGYINDEKFARYWVENRSQAKGASRRKLEAELCAKGVDRNIIEKSFQQTDRNDADELAKVIAKKQARYPDRLKFAQYLTRQGFRYDDVRAALDELDG